MRRISEIKNLPITQLSDEEIVKAAMHRLEGNYAMLIYLGKDENVFFLGRWRNAKGRNYAKVIMKAWEDKFGKMKRVTNKI